MKIEAQTEIISSHEEDGVTVIDEERIEYLYVTGTPEYTSEEIEG